MNAEEIKQLVGEEVKKAVAEAIKPPEQPQQRQESELQKQVKELTEQVGKIIEHVTKSQAAPPDNTENVQKSAFAGIL